MKEFFKQIWEKIKGYWKLFVIYIKMNWKHWLTLGLTKLIEILNENKELKKAQSECEATHNE